MGRNRQIFGSQISNSWLLVVFGSLMICLEIGGWLAVEQVVEDDIFEDRALPSREGLQKVIKLMGIGEPRNDDQLKMDMVVISKDWWYLTSKLKKKERVSMLAWL